MNKNTAKEVNIPAFINTSSPIKAVMPTKSHNINNYKGQENPFELAILVITIVVMLFIYGGLVVVNSYLDRPVPDYTETAGVID